MTELESLRAECERLQRLLDEHGIDWRPKPIRSVMSLQYKVELFRSLFVGREDVFARRWVSTASGKSGYQPVCSNEWSSVCNKKTFKCADCPNRAFQSIGYNDLYRHLEGKDTLGRDVLGTYAILPDHTCRFLCADFDDKSCEHGYQSDVSAYVGVCKKWGIHAYIERSRSGNGAHVWILFEDPVKAKRHPIILTSLTAHVRILAELIRPLCSTVITLVGSDSARRKREIMEKLAAMNEDERFVIVATGKYVGEGFDFPRLDTLFLAMPVSWKGLIAQYAGRLHRDYPGKTDVRIYDYVDLYVPVCEGMYQKRLNGYKAIGYSISAVDENLFSEIKTESIFDSENFERFFHADLTKTKKSLLIACKKLIWKRPPKVLELLNSLTLRGVEVMMVVSEAGYSEKDVENFGVRLRYSMHPNPNSVIIDRETIWYGSINFIGRSMPEATAIRLKDSSLAQPLLSSILNGLG